MSDDRQVIEEPRRPYDITAHDQLCSTCGERPCIAGSTLCLTCDEMWWQQLSRDRSASASAAPDSQLIGPGICNRCGVYGSLAAPHHYCPACSHYWRSDRAAAVTWASAVLASSSAEYVVIDTETTGVHPTAEIVEIAVLAPNGQVCFESLVQPKRPIPAKVTAIHHITNAMVAQAPTFPQIYVKLSRVLQGRNIVVYNAPFDRARISYALQANRLPSFGEASWQCAMQRYSAYTGAWNTRHRGYRWQRLPGAGHRARGDCHATLALLARIARG